MRRLATTCRGITQRRVMRVTDINALPGEWRPGLSWLVQVRESGDVASIERLVRAGLTDVAILTADDQLAISSSQPAVFVTAGSIKREDVVAVDAAGSLQVLYRASDAHHTVFLTNRCNSYCLMCSQPPTRHDDAWLIDEAKHIAMHIARSPSILGFTGGEPLLLGGRLREVLETFALYHPATQFDVLTNGRLLADRTLAQHLLSGLSIPVTWTVPLYGHTDFLHDYVVQSHGAFDQTIDGLLTLQSFGQPIQLRAVLIEPVLAALPELCRFVASNLPFVREMALMGCEPVGFALANRSACEIDIGDWQVQLADGVRILHRGGIMPVLMNLPLCALPRSLWRYAHRSISDWKQVYAPECTRCAVREDCCGLFAWHRRGWRPTTIRPIEEAV